LALRFVSLFVHCDEFTGSQRYCTNITINNDVVQNNVVHSPSKYTDNHVNTCRSRSYLSCALNLHDQTSA